MDSPQEQPQQQWDEVSPEAMRQFMEERAAVQRNRFVAIIITIVVIGGIGLFGWMRGREQIENVISSTLPASSPAPTAPPAPASQQGIDLLVQEYNDAVEAQEQAVAAITARQNLLQNELARLGSIVGAGTELVEVDGEFNCRYLQEDVANLGWGYIQQYYNRASTSDFFYRVGEAYVAYEDGNAVRAGMELCRK